MRVTLITKQIGNYHDARFRGAAAFIEDFVVISITNEAGFVEFLAGEASDYPVVRLFPSRNAYEAAVDDKSFGETLNGELDRLAPDIVVIAGWASAESFTAISWARRKGRPVVVMSESQAFDARRSRIREFIKARIVGLCDAALVGGPTQRDYIASLGIPDHCIHLGYNAVDNEYYARGSDLARCKRDEMRDSLELPPRYILASARFVAKKNLAVLVSAYARALNNVASGPDLVILGDGLARREIESAIAANGIGTHVHLCGFRGYKDLPALYGLAEAFVHVPVIEQWGLVVNEAMAAGLPLVVSKRCGATSALVRDGVHGFVVDPHDVHDMADALARMFNLDAAARLAMGRASRAAVADWGPERFGSGLKAAVQSALSRGRRPSLRKWDTMLLQYLAAKVIEDVA